MKIIGKYMDFDSGVDMKYWAKKHYFVPYCDRYQHVYVLSL